MKYRDVKNVFDEEKFQFVKGFPKLVSVDLRAMALILFGLKLIFRLDDKTEYILSEISMLRICKLEEI